MFSILLLAALDTEAACGSKSGSNYSTYFSQPESVSFILLKYLLHTYFAVSALSFASYTFLGLSPPAATLLFTGFNHA